MRGCRIRLWRFGRGRLRPVAQCEGADPPEVVVTPEGAIQPAAPGRCVVAVPGLDGYFFEVAHADGDVAAVAAELAPLLARLLSAERDALNLAKQLAARYEEIELLYSISEIVGRTVGLHAAAQTILEEVTGVVGARRGSLFVYDERTGLLRPLATVGRSVSDLEPVELDHPTSITARVFRTGTVVAFDPRRGEPPPIGAGADGSRGYVGSAFLSVPVTYPMPDGFPRPVGVLNLTDRFGTDAFSGGEQRLVTAVANQIGAAIEHERLIERDLARRRLERELELAHHLHEKLLPDPSILGPSVDAAAHCEPAERVGGDFYHFVRLGPRRIGVMLGDVSSHGFAAAMIMALVRAAAGIHAEEAASPDGALRALLHSVADELEETEMYLTLFYGVIDAEEGTLRYANAGHPHAFQVDAAGRAHRLGATSPPLGIASRDAIAAEEVAWASGEDLLVLFSDGITDARDAAGGRFGEDRVLDLVRAARAKSSDAILAAVREAVHVHEPEARDDRTVLVLRSEVRRTG